MASRPTHRGGATAQLLAGLVMVGTIAGAAVLFVPRGSVAEAPADLPAGTPEHQQVIDRLGQLVRVSHQVLAVHPRRSTPFAEVLLWLKDDNATGMVELPEIGLLSHSEVTQAITLRTLSSVDEAVWRPAAASWFSADGGLAWSAAQCVDRAWCDRLRAFDYLDVLTVAKGVSDMGLWWSEATEVGSPRLNISLTWAGDTADEIDQASITFSVLAPPLRGEE